MRGLKLPIIHGYKIFSLIADGIFRDLIRIQIHLMEPGQVWTLVGLLKSPKWMWALVRPDQTIRMTQFRPVSFHLCRIS